LLRVVVPAFREWQKAKDSTRSMLRKVPRVSSNIMSVLAFY
jgi:hypothetical protein